MGGFIGPALSIGGALLGGSSGGNSAPSSPNYQPADVSGQNAALLKLLSQNTNLVGNNNPYNTLAPQANQAFQTLFNTGVGGYANAAGTAGNGYGQVGQQSLNNSSALSTAGNQILNTAFDPQNALYAQMLQKTNDQANVLNSQYGLTGQQAAGNVQQADTNFNIDWQNQELQRQLAGLQGFGQAGTAAQNTGAAGAGAILSGGAAPYTTGQTIGGNQENALAQYVQQLLGPTTSSSDTIAQLMQYLGMGVNASAGQNANALQQYGAQVSGASAGAAGGAAIGNQLAGLFNTQAASPYSMGNGGQSTFSSYANLPALY